MSEIYRVDCDKGFFFQPVSNVESTQLKMSNISLYSTTPWREANFMNQTIVNYYARLGLQPSQLTVTDATANVGGNTISFYLCDFAQINAVEIDQQTYQMLVHNVDSYHATDRVSMYCDDYTQIYRDLQQDIIFIDPPWGGSDYKEYKSLDLYLGSQEISGFCRSLLSDHLATMIVVKVPYNYNYSRFTSSASGMTCMIENIYRKDRHCYSIIYCLQTGDTGSPHR